MAVYCRIVEVAIVKSRYAFKIGDKYFKNLIFCSPWSSPGSGQEILHKEKSISLGE